MEDMTVVLSKSIFSFKKNFIANETLFINPLKIVCGNLDQIKKLTLTISVYIGNQITIFEYKIDTLAKNKNDHVYISLFQPNTTAFPPNDKFCIKTPIGETIIEIKQDDNFVNAEDFQFELTFYYK